MPIKQRMNMIQVGPLYICIAALVLCPSFRTDDPKTGQEMYEHKCRKCHGTDGTKGAFKATNLQTSKADSATIQAVLQNGRNKMPSFKKSLTENEINSVASYIVTLRK